MKPSRCADNSGHRGGFFVFGGHRLTNCLPAGLPRVATSGSAGSTGTFANYNSVADWNSQNGNVTTVGTNGGPSAYGAFDMSGNLYEWNDLTGAAGSSRGLRGGDWFDGGFSLSSSGGIMIGPSGEISGVGFRLASPVSLPEPSTCAMALAGLACGGYSLFRRRKRA